MWITYVFYFLLLLKFGRKTTAQDNIITTFLKFNSLKKFKMVYTSISKVKNLLEKLF